MSKYIVFYLEIVFLVVIPVLLLTIKSDYFSFRPYLMMAGGIYSGYRLLRSEATMASLGIHMAKFKSATKALIIPSALFVFLTLMLFYFLPNNIMKFLVGYDPLSVKSFTDRLLSYIFISSPVQELIFRGYMTWRIKQVYSDIKIMEIISVTIFTFIHIPFYSPLLLIITFVMGILYIRNYQKYQNLFAPIISHSLVGASLMIIRNAWFPYS